MDNPLLNNSNTFDTGIFKPVEIAPIIKETKNETIFQGYGNSHISHVNNLGFHITTQVPGIPGGLSIHDNVNDILNR